MPALPDCGYEGAGHGVLTPATKPKGVKELDINARTRNMLLNSARCLGERGFALLSQRWKTFQHVTASPSEIGPIARTALVLTLFEHKRLTVGKSLRRPDSVVVVGVVDDDLGDDLARGRNPGSFLVFFP